MLQITFSFNEISTDEPLGFDLGNMTMIGNRATVTSESRTPNQSMMLILSIVQLLDGFRRFLSKSKKTEYEFCGIDCSFRIIFRKEKDNQIAVYAYGMLIHVAEPIAIKADIERSVIDFTVEYDLARLMNSAEAGDFEHALTSFRNFTPI